MPRATRSCSTCRTSARCACAAPARSPRCSGRSPTTSTASGPAGRSTRTCSIPTTRTSSTTSSCGGSATGEFLVMPNASNTAPLVDALGDAAVFHGAGECDDRRRHRRPRAVLAVQGPEARALLATVVARRGRGARASRSRRSTFGGVAGLRRRHRLHGRGRRRAARARGAARRRAGRRCSTPASRPPGSARATRCGSRPGCRCTATSSGPGITPLQAGLGWVVRFDKGDFRGRGAARGRARPGRRPPAARAARRGPPDPARRATRCRVDGDASSAR